MVEMHKTKLLLVNITINLVYDHGLHGTATAKIAEKAHVATGTLFHHFKTKQQLIEAAHRHIFDDYIWHLLGFFDYPDEKLRKQIKKAISASLDYWVRNPIYYSYMSQVMNSNYYNAELRVEEDLNLERQLGSAFKLAMKKGIFEKYSYPLLIRLFVRTVFQVAGLVIDAPKERRVKYRKQGLNFIWAAVSKR